MAVGSDRKTVLPQAAETLLEFPPMQKGASFNLEALKHELDKKMESRAAQ
jgi:arylsulfatase